VAGLGSKPASGRMIRFWPNHLLSIGPIETSPSSNPVALMLRDPSRPNIWDRTRFDRLDVGVTAINFWSGTRDLNPGPHGPEL